MALAMPSRVLLLRRSSTVVVPDPLSTLITVAAPVPRAASRAGRALPASCWAWASCLTSTVCVPAAAVAPLSFASTPLALLLAAMSSPAADRPPSRVAETVQRQRHLAEAGQARVVAAQLGVDGLDARVLASSDLVALV